MIHTAHVLNGLTHEEAYMLGWKEHADFVDLAVENEAALAASRSGRRLDDLLERVWLIAPYELPVPVAVAEAEPEPVPVVPVPFDWAEAA